MRRTPSGFTILELIVGLAIGSIVVTAAMLMIVVAVKTEIKARHRKEITANLSNASLRLASDLGSAGTGVPYGVELRADGTTLGSTPLTAADLARLPRPVIREATPTSIAFVGDLPFPNSDLNGIAGIGGLMNPVLDGNSPGDPTDKIAMTSELSPCGAPAAGATLFQCASSTANLMGIGGANCSSTNLGAPTCPWGLNKYPSGLTVDLIIGTMTRDFYYRRWDGSSFADDGERVFLNLTDNFPAANEHLINIDTIVSNGRMGGFIAQLDRVFWSYEDQAGGTCGAGEVCRLMRRQCWGPPATSAGLGGTMAWPLISAGATSSTTVPTGCAAGTQGTDWQEIINDVSAFSFRYYHDLGNELTGAWNASKASRARVVEFNIESSRTIHGLLIQESVTRRVYLPHPGGIIAPDTAPAAIALANGGCCDTVDCCPSCTVSMCSAH